MASFIANDPTVLPALVAVRVTSVGKGARMGVLAPAPVEPSTPTTGQVWPSGIDMPTVVEIGEQMPARETATITTASLVAGASESGTVALAKGYRLLAATFSGACRARLYSTAAKRDADAARPIGTDPTGDHGLMFEYVATGPGSADLSPTVDGFDGKTTPDGAIPFRITNTGSSAAVVTVGLSWIRTE